jgi:hypothetical protein
MGALRTILRRAGTVTAAAAAVTLAGSTMASAHHCYRDYWQPAAYEQHLKGNTPWVPLSDMGKMFLIGPDYVAQCGYVADDAVADFMAAHGLTQEPLIQSKATVGSGAYYKKGMEPKPFSYLSDADFGELTMSVIAGMAECAPDWTPPVEG